jgi:ABC-type bacteriocin/lantibiotic exporter with double-glycine peptidase domain
MNVCSLSCSLDDLIRVVGLQKKYDDTKKLAVRDMYLSIPRGETFGLLGKLPERFMPHPSLAPV